MLPLRELKEQKGLLDAYYLKTSEGGELRNIVMAKYKEEPKLWYHYATAEEYGISVVPADAIDLAADLQNQFDFSKTSDSLQVERAKEKVFPGVIEGIIEAVPFSILKKEQTVVFLDLLVVRSLDPNHYGMKVYVDSAHVGRTATRNLKHMVGQIVPVTIVNLNEQKRDKFVVSRGVKHNFVAYGNIAIAEWLMNQEYFYPLLRENNLSKKISQKEREKREADRKRIEETTYKGIVTRIANNGVWVLGKKQQTVFIRFRDLNYKAHSRVLDRRNSVEQGEEIKFKLTASYLQNEERLPDLKTVAVLGKNQMNMLVGESISLQESPMDQLRKLIDSKNLVGKTFTAHLISYDSVKGHLIELEAFPGVLVKLQKHDLVKPKLAITKESIIVSVRRARYKLTEDGKPHFTIQCQYISKLGNIESVTEFFDF